MSTKVSAVKIMQFKAYADNVKHGGNNNGYVDGAEIKVFEKKCKTAGIDNINEIMEAYNENKVQREAEFDANKIQANSSIETAVIAALADSTVLRDNTKNIKTAVSIKEGIKNADNARNWWNPFSWFNNEEEILNSTANINSKNVLEVIEDTEVIDKIGNADEDYNIRNTAINQVISSLIEAANERKIDISNLVIENDGKFLTGRDIKDLEFGTEISDNETFTTVINAIKAQIKNGQKTINGENNNKVEMLTMAAKRIDAQGNGNGYIDTVDEIKAFKQFSAQKGYDVDTILEQIRDNEENGVENTTLAQQTIYNIFDPEQKAAYEKLIADESKNVSREYKDGLANDNEELLTKAASEITSDNVMQVLNDNKGLVDGLVNEYDFNWVRNLFGNEDRYQNYTTPILKALCDYAIENGIEIDDIVMVSDDKYVVGGAVAGAEAGKDATDADNVVKVVQALQARINKEQA